MICTLETQAPSIGSEEASIGVHLQCFSCLYGHCFVSLLSLFSNSPHANNNIAGLAATVNSYDGPQWQGWTRLYNLTFLVSLVWSFLLFWGVNVLFPIQGLGEDGPFEGGNFVMGLDVADGSSQGDVEQGKVKSEVETTTALA